jgi:GTPase SAR1 family protein
MREGIQSTTDQEAAEQLVFRRLNLTALEDNEAGSRLFCMRKEPLAKIVENILYYESGCYMISGQRGCGKTSLINQLIYLLSNIEQENIQRKLKTVLEIDENIIPERISIFPVRIDIVKKYDEKELLQKILRMICDKFLEISSEEKEREEIRRRIGDNLFMALENLILDTKESLDYRKVISVGAGKGKMTSFGLRLSLAFSETFSALIESTEFQAKIAEDFSHQISKTINRNVSTEAREFTIEKLENRLEEAIRSFIDPPFVKKLEESNIERLFTDGEIEKILLDVLQGRGILEPFEKNFGKISKFCKKLMKSVVDKFIKYEVPTEVKEIFDKIVIIIDDTDKADYEEAIEVLSSLKALFQSRNCFFLFVGSERFYEDWHSQSNPAERGPLDSIFTHVLYIPPFSISETRSLLKKYLQGVTGDLDYYASVLIMVAYGLPRQMLRTLDLITVKEKDRQVVEGEFFGFFKQDRYPKLIQDFADKFTKYNDPRMEKCLYIASAILTFQEKMNCSVLREFLNDKVPTYPDDIKERITEDLAKIVGSRSVVYYEVNTHFASAYLEMDEHISQDKKSILWFFRKSFQDGYEIHVSELDKVFLLLFGDTRQDLIDFLLDRRILTVIRKKELRLRPYNFIFGPQEILKINRRKYKPRDVKPSLSAFKFFQTAFDRYLDLVGKE